MYSDQLLLPSNLFVPQALCALRPVEHKIIESIAPIYTWKVRKSFESYCGTWECDEDDDYATDEASWSFLPIASLELPSWESGHGAKKPPLFEATKTVPQRSRSSWHVLALESASVFCVHMLVVCLPCF